MAKYEGKCPSCGKVHRSMRKDDIAVCDCWHYCPLCAAEMMPYVPDLAPKSYGLDSKCDFAVVMVCLNHCPPFFSVQKPVEVECV